MKINSLTTEQVFETLVTSEHGLSDDEARIRLAENGFNEIQEVRKTSLAVRFARQFTHFLAVLLWIGSFLCFISEYLHPGEGMITLGFAILGVIVINALFSFFQEHRAEKALEALKKMLPFYVKVIRGGQQKEVLARDIVIGDVVLLKEGDRVPADARIIQSVQLRVNNAPLTGESDQVLRTHEPADGELLDSPNIVFAGSSVVSGSGKAVIYAIGMRTEFGLIAHLTSAVETGLSPLQKEIVKTSRVVAAIASCVGVFFFIIGFLIGQSFWNNFVFAIGITVALIPEGMLPTVTLALAMGGQRMARRKALIKQLTSVETLGSVTVICTDKTGTLTQNKMEASKIWVYNRTSDASDCSILKDHLLMQAAYCCTNAERSGDQFSGDPTEVALLRLAHGCLGERATERLAEIPFDPDRKRMTVLNRIDRKLYIFTKGAFEGLLVRCIAVDHADMQKPLDDETREEIRSAYNAMTDTGLRVLMFAYREISPDDNHLEGSLSADEIESNLVVAGLIGLQDPPRPEVPDALKKCHEAGIRVIMITGDSSRTAVAIAREIGLVRALPLVIEGSEFMALNDSVLREKLSSGEIIFSRMTPKHKLRVVTILKEQGERVAVTGDGVNDAPALKKADIGIAMGITGTDVAKEASDMILLDDNFSTIVNAVEEGRTVYENIKKFISYIFASNIPEAVPYLAYILFRIPLPLTIMQILAVDLGTDMFPALALGAEKPTPDIMKKPPRRSQERMINAALIARAYLFLGVIEAAACMYGYFYVLYKGGWQWGSPLQPMDPLYLQATTACLTAIIITQVANVFACRSMGISVFSLGLFSNKLILIGIAVELALQIFIVYHPLGNHIFGTLPVPLSIWLNLIPFAAALLLADEARKLFGKKMAAA